ncbi:hypothetical protein [Sphingomonas phage Carli]|nr:hypothetical protein [Sphingomonas phage Carli]
MGVEEIVSESRRNRMTDTPTTLTVKCEIDVPFERITNCITGAIEGGSTYWCNQFMASDDEQSTRLYQTARNEGDVWYDSENYWTGGGTAALAFDQPTAEHSGKATIGQTQLVNGLNVMAQIAPRHFGDLLNENDDATTHDVFLQCVLFGEVVFG